jgi:hypothetical protein
VIPKTSANVAIFRAADPVRCIYCSKLPSPQLGSIGEINVQGTGATVGATAIFFELSFYKSANRLMKPVNSPASTKFCAAKFESIGAMANGASDMLKRGLLFHCSIFIRLAIHFSTGPAYLFPFSRGLVFLP